MTSFDTICPALALQFQRLLADERGATAVEYAMIASGVGAAIAATVWSLGTVVKDLYLLVAGVMPG